MMAMGALSDGTSIITEQVYHDRFTHVAELNRLGARITLDNNVAVIEGRQHLSGAHVMATDLRASRPPVAWSNSSGETKQVTGVCKIEMANAVGRHKRRRNAAIRRTNWACLTTAQAGQKLALVPQVNPTPETVQIGRAHV